MVLEFDVACKGFVYASSCSRSLVDCIIPFAGVAESKEAIEPKLRIGVIGIGRAVNRPYSRV